jgi:tryptophan-rich sensory protein
MKEEVCDIIIAIINSCDQYKKMKNKDYFLLAISIIIAELAGCIGSIFSAPAINTWYAGIIKPSINPPAWVFGPIWTTLFALMGIALFLVLKEIRKGKINKTLARNAIMIFSAQLMQNILWSVLFFGMHSPAGAFFEIIGLWFSIFATMVLFSKISKPAMYLLVPYILWVTFAAYLNYLTSILNHI